MFLDDTFYFGKGERTHMSVQFQLKHIHKVTFFTRLSNKELLSCLNPWAAFLSCSKQTLQVFWVYFLEFKNSLNWNNFGVLCVIDLKGLECWFLEWICIFFRAQDLIWYASITSSASIVSFTNKIHVRWKSFWCPFWG